MLAGFAADGIAEEVDGRWRMTDSAFAHFGHALLLIDLPETENDDD